MNLQKLHKIIEKNMKLLLRSKSSAVIIIFGPIVLITLLGLAFGNTQQYTLNVGVYSSDYNAFSESLLAKLNQRGYGVIREPAETICIEHVKTKDSNVCMVFPKDLEVKQDVIQDITFHVDFSNINLVYSIISAISSGVDDKAKEVSISLTQDLLNRLQRTEAIVDERVPTLVGLTQKSDTIKQETERMFLTMNNLNLTLESNASLVQVETEIAFLRNLAYESIRETNDLVDVLDAEVKTLHGNKTGAEHYLDTADEQFAQFRSDLSDSDAKMQQHIGGLRTYVADVNNKLGAVQNTRGSVLTSLTNIKTDLQSSVGMLNDLQTSLNEMKRLTTTVEITNAEKIVNPLTTHIVPITEEETHFNYLFPTLLVLVIMITSILLASTIIMVEKKSKSFFRNYITPTSETLFLFGTYLTTLIIMVMQVSIFLLISSLFFDTAIVPSLFKTPILLFFIVSFFILVGTLIGIFFKSEELTTLASITVASVMLFFSSTILPLESMPPFFKTLASLNPFVLSESLLKEAILFNLDLATLMDKMYLLILYSIIIAVFCVKLQQWLRDDMFYNLHKSRRFVELRGMRVFSRFSKAGANARLRIKRAMHPQVGLKQNPLRAMFGFLTLGLFQKSPASPQLANKDSQVEQDLMHDLDPFSSPAENSVQDKRIEGAEKVPEKRALLPSLSAPPPPPPELSVKKGSAETSKLREKLKKL
ncbi:MAG: ABC transporter permease [Candidatus Woesearchaeota archaeon]|nr:ABC transporter permease [Candidatus Woesearchaeota archaeon]